MELRTDVPVHDIHFISARAGDTLTWSWLVRYRTPCGQAPGKLTGIYGKTKWI